MRVVETTSEGADVRVVLTGMIVSDLALARIASSWPREGEFDVKWQNALGNLCVNYFRQYNAAPGEGILDVYSSWAEGRIDKDTVELSQTFLAGLMSDYERAAEAVNSDYVITTATKLFNKIRQLKLCRLVQQAHEVNRPERADAAVSEFKRFTLETSPAADIFNDPSLASLCAKRHVQSLFSYPGDAEEFFAKVFVKGRFVGVMAPEKRGKSFFLYDVAWRIATNRKRVLLIDAGDMDLSDIVARFAARSAGRPTEADTFKRPTFLEVSGDNIRLDTEEISCEEDMTVGEIREAFGRVAKRQIRSKEPYLKVLDFPSGTLTVQDVKNQVDDFCQSGWIPDAVIIDYADILTVSSSRDDYRHRINEVWLGLRGLSKSGCKPLVVTATQTNRESYDAGQIKMKHVGEDKRKLAHVSTMIGIGSAKQEGVVLLTIDPNRHRGKGLPLYVAQCLATGEFMVLNTFPKKRRGGPEDEP